MVLFWIDQKWQQRLWYCCFNFK